MFCRKCGVERPEASPRTVPTAWDEVVDCLLDTGAARSEAPSPGGAARPDQQLESSLQKASAAAGDIVSEAEQLVKAVKHLAQRLATATQERDSQAAHARRLMETVDREAERSEATRAEVAATRLLLDATRQRLAAEAEAKAQRPPEAAKTPTSMLGGPCLAALEAERGALKAEIAIARRGVDAAHREAEACRQRLTCQEPLLHELRAELRLRYAKNGDLSRLNAALRNEACSPIEDIEDVEDLSFEEGAEEEGLGTDLSPHISLQICVS